MNEPSVFNGPEVSAPRDAVHKSTIDGHEVEHRDNHNLYGHYLGNPLTMNNHTRE